MQGLPKQMVFQMDCIFPLHTSILQCLFYICPTVCVCLYPIAFKPEEEGCELINTSPLLIVETVFLRKRHSGVFCSKIQNPKPATKCNFAIVNSPRHSVIIPADTLRCDTTVAVGVRVEHVSPPYVLTWFYILSFLTHVCPVLFFSHVVLGVTSQPYC